MDKVKVCGGKKKKTEVVLKKGYGEKTNPQIQKTSARSPKKRRGGEVSRDLGERGAWYHCPITNARGGKRNGE